MVKLQKRSLVPEPAPQVFHISVASTNRTKCRLCENKIDKGALKLSTKIQSEVVHYHLHHGIEVVSKISAGPPHFLFDERLSGSQTKHAIALSKQAITKWKHHSRPKNEIFNITFQVVLCWKEPKSTHTWLRFANFVLERPTERKLIMGAVKELLTDYLIIDDMIVGDNDDTLSSGASIIVTGTKNEKQWSSILTHFESYDNGKRSKTFPIAFSNINKAYIMIRLVEFK